MVVENMIQTESYQKEKLTIDIVWANIFAVLMLIPIVLIYGFPYYLSWGADFSLDSLKYLMPKAISIIPDNYLVMFSTLIGGIILHELIHGLAWLGFTKKGLKSIKFGIMWKMLTPYCHCKEPLLIKHYIFGAIMPALILGLIPAIYSIAVGSVGWLLFGMIFTMAAGGDFLVINLLRKESMNSFVQDHPSEAGCYIYRKEERQASL